METCALLVRTTLESLFDDAVLIRVAIRFEQCRFQEGCGVEYIVFLCLRGISEKQARTIV